MEHETVQDFAAVKQRLESIADAVDSADMPLDEALDLFEEAVALGLQISDLLESGLDEAADVASDEAAPEAGA